MKILVLILIALLLYFIYFSKNNLFDNIDHTNLKRENKLYFITFGGGKINYHKRVEQVVEEVKQFNLFDNIYGITDLDLKKDNIFWDKHENFINSNNRGYGYWLWKPYILLKQLKSINYNDIIVYADVGCHFNIDNKNRLLEYINILQNSNYGILSFVLPFQEKVWTKGDLFKYFNCENNEEIKNSNQNHATFMIIKKNDHSIKLIEQWYNIGSHYNLINDSPSITPNDYEFIEHRHDQAIYSLLVKIYGSEKIKDERDVFLDVRNIGLN
jgi:hypothetical protein